MFNDNDELECRVVRGEIGDGTSVKKKIKFSEVVPELGVDAAKNGCPIKGLSVT